MSELFPVASYRVDIAVTGDDEDAENIRVRVQRALDEEFGAAYVGHL